MKSSFSFSLRPRCLSRLALGIGLTALAGGCGSNNVGSKLAPKDPSASDALGETLACTTTDTVAEPYVVDLRGADRSHLEAVMSEGIAVVRYGCNGLEVLRGCSVRGAADPYTFVGVSMKEDQVQIDTLDQLRANLPASAVQLAGEVTSGAAIDIGLVMVGRKSIRDDMVARPDLEGPGCEGATHFVRSAIVGAFAVEKGTQGKARVAAEIFGAGASAGSEASRRVANRDGKPEDCNTARPGKVTTTCVELAELYAQGGKGLAKDPAKAQSLLRTSCDGGSVSACMALGKQLQSTDVGIARAFYEDACARTKFPPLCRSSEQLGGRGLPPKT